MVQTSWLQPGFLNGGTNHRHGFHHGFHGYFTLGASTHSLSFHLLKCFSSFLYNNCPLLVLKGIYHYWTYLPIFPQGSFLSSGGARVRARLRGGGRCCGRRAARPIPTTASAPAQGLACRGVWIEVLWVGVTWGGSKWGGKMGKWRNRQITGVDFFGGFARTIEGDSWFTWWFFLIYQGYPSISPKRTPMPWVLSLPEPWTCVPCARSCSNWCPSHPFLFWLGGFPY